MHLICVAGSILLGVQQFDAALGCYRKAYTIDKRDMAVFQGIVDAHLGASKFKDALFAAKEALQLMPRNPRALTLIGLVLSHSPEGREKARAAFTKALALDPFCIDAVFAMVKLDTTEKKYQSAAALLNKHLLQHNRDYVHTRLANIYVLMGDHRQAVLHFQTALSLNQNYQPALQGLEQLDATLKGTCGSRSRSACCGGVLVVMD